MVCRRPPRDRLGEGVELRESDPREVVPLRLEEVASPLDIVSLEAVLSEAAECVELEEWAEVSECLACLRERWRQRRSSLWLLLFLLILHTPQVCKEKEKIKDYRLKNRKAI